MATFSHRKNNANEFKKQEKRLIWASEAWRGAIAGANWANGVLSGSSTLNTNANPWNTNGNVCVRGFSDALNSFKKKEWVSI